MYLHRRNAETKEEAGRSRIPPSFIALGKSRPCACTSHRRRTTVPNTHISSHHGSATSYSLITTPTRSLAHCLPSYELTPSLLRPQPLTRILTSIKSLVHSRMHTWRLQLFPDIHSIMSATDTLGARQGNTMLLGGVLKCCAALGNCTWVCVLTRDS
jgi:hypothetical protein